jgi:shikimate 5-dehydrogenase
MFPNKDTIIYGSFSKNPGNNGCEFFNNKFKKHKINAIYKSFYSDNIENSIQAVKTLNFGGFAVSMPFKREILKYVNPVLKEDEQIGAINTVINIEGELLGYNLDKIGVFKYLSKQKIDFLHIVGNGGFGRSVQTACDLLKIKYRVFPRKNWGDLEYLKTGIIFNATPAEVISDKLQVIDARPFTEEGKKISKLIAEEQFKLYIDGKY